MNYIVFDLEWNQCPYGKDRENDKLPFEIIEIGAVKLDEQRNVLDQYHTLIQPFVYKKLHFRTKEIIGLSMKTLEKGTPFYKAIRDFLKWCGDDPRFCTWGSSDLVELQRNMKYYGLLKLLEGPIRFCDVQKMFSISHEDGKSRRSLEYAVDFLHLDKGGDFHRALADAVYTAKVLQKIDPHTLETYYSIDTYQNPRKRAQEIYVTYEDYAKFVSRSFNTKEEAMSDREVVSTRCIYCRKNARKKIRWFSVGAHNYYSLSLCQEHGYMKGKIRMRHNDDGDFYVIKTIKAVDEEKAAAVREKQESVRDRRKNRRHPKE